MQNRFNFTKSDAYKTIKARRFITSWPVKAVEIILFVVSISSLFYFGASSSDNFYASIGLFCGVALTMLAILDIYINFHREEKNFRLTESLNSNNADLSEFFEIEGSAVVLTNAIELKRKYRLKSINPSVLFLAMINSDFGVQVLLRCEIFISRSDQDLILAKIRENEADESNGGDFDENSRKILLESLKIAQGAKRNCADSGDLFIALFSDPLIKNIFSDKSIESLDLENIISWYRRIKNYARKQYFWQKKYYGPGIGQEWASGYTPTLNYFSKDISEYLVEAKLQTIALSHNEVINSMEESLVKSSKNNVILIGAKGIGKKTIVNAFTQKVIRGEVHDSLRYKHVFELDINRLLAGTSKAELEMRFSDILNDASRAGNIIIYIDQIDALLNSQDEELGSVNASQFLVPFLESADLQVIGTTDPASWHNKIETNARVANLFTKITVDEPKIMEMAAILEDAIMFIEYKNRAIFTYNSVKSIIKLSDRFIHNEVFPQKALDLAENLSVNSQSEKRLNIINAEKVEKYVTEKFKVPASEAQGEEKDKLLNLEDQMHKRIIDQVPAVSSIANAMRRARVGLSKKNKPIGSFLFIGPTGVGKTETAKALADIYFGSEKNMVRFDMSEYQEANSIERLIGGETAKSRGEQGLLSIAIHDNPYTVFLFDELEKANANILNLFLQMLDEGSLTDALGQKLDFTNSIIIATSNAGAEEIRQYIKAQKSMDKLSAYILNYLQESKQFKPEFLNRFDGIICFKPLSNIEITQIAKLMINKLKALLTEKEINLVITEPAIEKLAQLGYDPALGARPMQRVLQEKVENLIAQKLLKNEIKKGETFTIDIKDIV